MGKRRGRGGAVTARGKEDAHMHTRRNKRKAPPWAKLVGAPLVVWKKKNREPQRHPFTALCVPRRHPCPSARNQSLCPPPHHTRTRTQVGAHGDETFPSKSNKTGGNAASSAWREVGVSQRADSLLPPQPLVREQRTPTARAAHLGVGQEPTKKKPRESVITNADAAPMPALGITVRKQQTEAGGTNAIHGAAEHHYEEPQEKRNQVSPS